MEPMPLVFHGNSSFTLGVELELQLVDAETGALTSAITEILGRVPAPWAEKIKPEFMQSYCEINTDVCRTVGDVERDLTEKLDWMMTAANDMGLRVLWAGTHPFSRWDDQNVTEGERYAWLLETMQDIGRRLLVFGLHVHVGVTSGDKAIQMCDRLLKHLPTLLALSSNSPFWCGRDTGMGSYRSKILEALPTAGLPQTMRNWSEYVWLVEHLISTGFIRSVRENWWDVRPHHEFGTVEIRVMDMPMNLSHTLGLVALTQSLVAAISDNIDRGAYQYDCHPMVARQNKWQAARYGMDAVFVDPDTMGAVPARQTSLRLLDRVRPFAERLDCAPYLSSIEDIVTHGSGAARQRAVYASGGEMNHVVRFLMDQGLGQNAAAPR
jgi:carboxylate-amine ligase